MKLDDAFCRPIVQKSFLIFKSMEFVVLEFVQAM